MKKSIFITIIILCVMILGGGIFASIWIHKIQNKRLKLETNSATTKEAATTEMVTTERNTEASTEEVPDEEEPIKNGITIEIDPGHQGPNVNMSDTEPNGPGSSTMNQKATGGTSGRFSKLPEYQLNLDVSLALEKSLLAQGYDVVMTRKDNDTAISNKERALLAGEKGADICVRIHANGCDDASVSGALAMVGSKSNPYVGSLYENSNRLASSILDAYCAATGMNNGGVVTTDTMTGINWSKVPVMILEMGYMTNEQDDLNMANAKYQEKMVEGIVNGINEYYGITSNDKESKEELKGLEEQLSSIISTAGFSDAQVSYYIEDFSNQNYAKTNDTSMKAASLIKLYVAGCVYEQMDNLISLENVQGETKELVKKMITVSDNEACNELVRRLGKKDAKKGMELVNQYCENHGFTNTSMGRLMLDFNSGSENYTSVNDCGIFLKNIYNKELPGSEDILEYMKQQQRKAKIPAGVPQGVATANKTGELDDTENDVAFVFGPDKTYILCVMTSNLQDTSAARTLITSLSSKVYLYLQGVK